MPPSAPDAEQVQSGPAPAEASEPEGISSSMSSSIMSSSISPSSISSSSSSPLLNIFLRINTSGPRLDAASTHDFLTLRDLYVVRAVCRPVRAALTNVEYNRCRDGRDYLVPFPAYPGTLTTPSDRQAGAGLFSHQLASLQAMHRAENANTEFGALRGGILGDAPGLGKTITMLAHIASTAGCVPVQPAEFFDEDSIDEHWQMMRLNPVFRMEILRAMKPLRDWAQASSCSQLYSQLERYVSPPYEDDRLPTLRSFERHVRRTLAPHVPFDLLELFRRNVNAFKAGLDKHNRRFFASDKGQRVVFERNLIPCSSTLIVVPDALLEHWAEQMRRHLQLEVFADGGLGGGEGGGTGSDNGDANANNNRTCAACHELKPKAEFSKTQLRTKPDGKRRCKDCVQNGSSSKSGNGTGATSLAHGVVYIDGVGDLSEARFPLNHHGGQLPSAYHLMSHMVVVVPFPRIQDQFRTRKRRRCDGNGADYVIEMESFKNSPLLQLRWQRVVCDEGHELGASPAGSEVTQFINLIASERRWVLSGTPTTGDEDNKEFTKSGLLQFQRLLLFLRHPEYGIVPTPDALNGDSSNGGRNTGSRDSSGRKAKQQNKDSAKLAWDTTVMTPFLGKQEAGRQELYRIMNQCMVMHKKEDINLPRPVFKQGEVEVPVPLDVQCDIVEAVCSSKRDVDYYLDVLHRMKVEVGRRGADLTYKLQMTLSSPNAGKDLFDLMFAEYMATDDYQMMVDEAQATYISDTVRQERRQLEARGGAIENVLGAPITLATNDDSLSDPSNDRRPVKAVIYSESHTNLLSVAEFLYERFPRENLAELCEGRIAEMTYELSRFRNNYKEGKHCPICNCWNEFKGKNLTSCHNRLLEVEDAEGRIFLIEPERILRAVSVEEYNAWSLDRQAEMVGNTLMNFRLPGTEADKFSKYGLSPKYWRVDDGLIIDARDPHPLLPRRWNQKQWEQYGSQQCMELFVRDLGQGRDNYFGPLPEYENEGDALNVIVKIRKWSKCGTFHGTNRWYTGPTLVDTEIETIKEDVFMMLLDASLATGLDLSFVTHLFLLEPIDDAALLEQVTSRAHRLGCTGPVVVETVNVWQGKHEESTKAVAKQLAASIVEEENRRTSTAVCEHCYRSFESMEKAENHEHKCERNPDSSAEVDPFHLSSVYRDICPPPPMAIGDTRGRKMAGLADEDNNEGTI